MELAPVPRRTVPPRVRVGLALVVLTPVTLLALLPTMFGLERYVISADTMAGSIDRGSVVFEREVASSQLRVGDVITFPAPPGHGVEGLVTHRIVQVDAEGIRTQGDALAEPDPWTLRRDVPTRPRVLLDVPYIGYPFLDPGRRYLWAAVAAGLAVTVAGALLGRGSRRRPRPQAGVAADDAPGRTEVLSRPGAGSTAHRVGGSG